MTFRTFARRLIRSLWIVGGSLFLSDDLTVTWDGSYVTNPPPGFFDSPPMKTVASTWKQVVH